MLDEVKFDTVVYSLDWHPANHVSFVDNVALRKLHKDNKVREIMCPSDSFVDYAALRKLYTRIIR